MPQPKATFLLTGCCDCGKTSPFVVDISKADGLLFLRQAIQLSGVAAKAVTGHSVPLSRPSPRFDSPCCKSHHLP
jgi:hypothetical protein